MMGRDEIVSVIFVILNQDDDILICFLIQDTICDVTIISHL